MSSTTVPNLDLDEQIARIRRAQAETDKFAAETQKLANEALMVTSSLVTGLASEGRKFDRERLISTLLAISGLAGGILAIVQFALHLKGVK